MFCQIVNKEVAAEIVYQDSDVIVFPDIKPKAKTHLLVVPVPHINSFLDLSDKQMSTLTKMVKVIQTIIKDQKLEDSYQLVFNGGKRQHVPHLHWHLLGD